MKMLKWIAAVGLIALLYACGGGGGSAGTSGFGTSSGSGSGTNTGTTGSASLAVAITAGTVTSASPATVTATLLDASGTPVANSVVSFSTTLGLGAFSAATALTDSSGVATVTMTPAASKSAGADTVVASATVGTTAVTGSIGFQSGGSSASTTPNLALTLSSASVSTLNPVTATVKLRNASGAAVANTVVSFSSTLGLGAFSPVTALTDSTGTASVLLSPAPSTSAGADTVVATATVDSVAVSASAGFQSAGSTASTSPTLAMSLSATTVTAAKPATVSVLVLDGSSKPVANSVVTFSTLLNLGSFNINTALTDASGTATAVLSPAASTTAGADTAVATASVGGKTVTASQGFQLTATNVTVASFASSIGTSQLSAYGQTGLTLTLGSTAAGVPVTVSVSSTCVTSGKATLTPASVTTTNGVANFTYKDAGCGATVTSDSVLATVGASTATSTLAVALTSPLASSIQFVSATPSTIYLKSSGYTETSTVVFEVVDLSGNALPNQSVTLDATTLAGGLTLDGGTTVTKSTDANGLVSVLVNSGTVPTPVRIKASLNLPTTPATTITTVSSSLAIAVGLPSEVNFSLSQGTINIEGFNHDGTTNTYNIIASDRMGNPVPAGTAINFVTEGGQVQPTQQIALVNGLARATANFVSADPRPADGRVTVLAYALGEESFLDTNRNNIYDAGEDFQDLGDLYIDRAFNGAYDQANDQAISLSLGGHSVCVASASSLLALDQSIPSIPGTCDGVWGKAYVRKATETVLSTSAARPVWGVTRPTAIAGSSCSTTQLVGDDLNSYNFYPVGSDGLAVAQAAGSFGFLVADANAVRLNPMAATTAVAATATTGLTVTVNGGSTVAVPNTSSANAVSIGYVFATGTSSGTITLQFTSPLGLQTAVPLNIQQSFGVPCPLMSATVANATPTKISLQFSQPMDTTKTPPNDAFDAGTAHAITSVNWASDTELDIIVATAYVHADNPDLSYSAPAAAGKRVQTAATAATSTATAIGSIPLSSFDNLSIKNSVK